MYRDRIVSLHGQRFHYTDWGEVAAPVVGIDNMWLVPAGVIPSNPSELLSSPQMRALVVDLCDRADVVLLDSPPCALYADAVELTDSKGGTSKVVIADVMQSNGVIHVVDTVLMP